VIAASQFEGVERAALPAKPLHLAIGMFDGVHLGHRAVIAAAVAAARSCGGTAGVLTFWPHPSALFRPEQATKLIQDSPTKTRVLATLGVDAIVTQPFTLDLAKIPAEEFLSWLKKRLPVLAGVYIGENFRFGRGRSGDAALLAATARDLGVSVFSAPRVKMDGEPISSTRIRRLLETGEIEAANALLGYSYFAAGVVTPGKRLGRSIGFPTLNVAWSPGLRPKLGVYAVRVSGEKSAQPLAAVANYGLRPTVEQAVEPRLEVHVLGECPFGAGDPVMVEWLKFLRPELKFGGVEELRVQIAKDRDAAQAWFGLG
jgi:riboflavin kinase/FMN adenylyltransferase